MIKIDYDKLREYIYKKSFNVLLRKDFNITDIEFNDEYGLEHRSYYVVKHYHKDSVIRSIKLTQDETFITFHYFMKNGCIRFSRFKLDVLIKKGIIKDER